MIEHTNIEIGIEVTDVLKIWNANYMAMWNALLKN